MLKSFRDKTVLITGASSGIGEALARALAAEGARLILTARSKDKLEALSRELAPADVTAIPAALCELSAIEKLCAEARRLFPALDILINNAGAALNAPSDDGPPDLAQRVFALNFFAPVELVRQLSPAIPEGGAVVNISSLAGKVPLPGVSLYCASKYALNAYSDGLRMELRRRGVHVLSVCPGYVDTAFTEHALGAESSPGSGGPRPFMITPEQCARATLDGLRRGKRTVVTPRIGWALIAFTRMLPGVVFGLMARGHHPAKPGAGGHESCTTD